MKRSSSLPVMSFLRQTAEIVDPADIKPVAGHVSACYDRLVLIWGGYYEDDGNPIRPCVYNHPRYVQVFDTETKKWFRFATNGPHPAENCGCCGILVDHIWYIFGGFYDSHELDSACNLYALNLRTLAWTIIQPTTKFYPTPRHKFVGWEHQNKLYFFGGFGPPASAMIENGAGREYLDDHVKFVHDNSTVFYETANCWNDQLVAFDLKLKCWNNVLCKGDIPSARAAHAAVKLGDNQRVVMFGGRHRENRLNDLYILHLKNFSWMRICTEVSPIPRSWHTLTMLDERFLILYGGFSQDRKPLNDVWYLDTVQMKWMELKRDCKRQNRLWHTAGVVKGSLFVFGGCKSDILEHSMLRQFTNEMFVIHCSPKSLLRTCLDFCLKQKSKEEFIRHLPPSVVKKTNVEAGYSFPKLRTPFEILSL